jgi:hypothetical protein
MTKTQETLQITGLNEETLATEAIVDTETVCRNVTVEFGDGDIIEVRIGQFDDPTFYRLSARVTNDNVHDYERVSAILRANRCLLIASDESDQSSEIVTFASSDELQMRTDLLRTALLEIDRLRYR